MSGVDVVCRDWKFFVGVLLALAVAIGSFLAARPSAAGLASQLGLGFLFCGAVVGYVSLFTISIPWLVRVNLDLRRPALPASVRDSVDR